MKIDEKEIQNSEIVRKIGSGATATCYLTKDGKVYKKFLGNIDYNRLYLEQLVTCKNPNITFPQKLVYKDNELVGYIKEYASGVEIDSLDDNINIKRFVEAIKLFEENIYDTFFSLVFTDLSGENIVYDEKENKITIIDTDFFEPVEVFEATQSERKEKINTFIENKKWINQSFYTFFKDIDGLGGYLENYVKEGYSGMTSTSFALKKAIEELEKLTNNEIITLYDYKNAIIEAKEQINGKTRI